MGAGASANMSYEQKRDFVKQVMDQIMASDEAEQILGLKSLMEIASIEENKLPLTQDSLGVTDFLKRINKASKGEVRTLSNQILFGLSMIQVANSPVDYAEFMPLSRENSLSFSTSARNSLDGPLGSRSRSESKADDGYRSRSESKADQFDMDFKE